MRVGAILAGFTLALSLLAACTSSPVQSRNESPRDADPGGVETLLAELPRLSAEEWLRRLDSMPAPARHAILDQLNESAIEETEAGTTDSPGQTVMKSLLQRLKGDPAAIPPAVQLRLLVYANLHTGRPGFFPVWGAGPAALPYVIRMRTDRHHYVHSFIPYVILELVRMWRLGRGLSESWWREQVAGWLKTCMPEERPYYEGLLAVLGDAGRLDGVLPAGASGQPADQAWVATLFLDLFGSEMPYTKDETQAAHLALMGVPGDTPHPATWAQLAAQAGNWHARNRDRIRYDLRSGRYSLKPGR